MSAYTVPLAEKFVLDACWRFNCACIVVEAANIVCPLNVLLSEERSVEDAAVSVPVMMGVKSTPFVDITMLCPNVAPWNDCVEVENEMVVPVVVA